MQIIWYTMLSILVPLLLAGTLRKRPKKMNIIKDILGLCTATIQPIQLHYELTATKFVKKKLFILNDVTLAPNFKEALMKIKCLEEEIIRHSRLQLGLETIFQVAANAILLFYAYSKTKARHGLSSLFDQNTDIFMGFSLPPEVVIGALLAINLLSFIKIQMNGMVEGYASNYQTLGKVMLLVSIICAILVRICSMTLYFSPSLGLFDLLHHFQGKPYQTE